MEFLILSTLSFDLTVPTSYRFLERYMRILGEDENVMTLSQFMMELSLIDVRMLQYQYSIIAAASLCQAYKTITRRMYPHNSIENDRRIEQYVRDTLGLLSRDESDALQLCCKELHFLQMRSMNSSLQAVRKKYQSQEYSSIHPFIFS